MERSKPGSDRQCRKDGAVYEQVEGVFGSGTMHNLCRSLRAMSQWKIKALKVQGGCEKNEDYMPQRALFHNDRKEVDEQNEQRQKRFLAITAAWAMSGLEYLTPNGLLLVFIDEIKWFWGWILWRVRDRDCSWRRRFVIAGRYPNPEGTLIMKIIVYCEKLKSYFIKFRDIQND